jgi:flagellar hook-associated protein 1 FlgK
MSLFSALLSSADTLRAYDRSLSVIQNNVSNVDTPGYAQQRLTFIPRQFDVNQGLSGGVDSGRLISFRDDYSERDVWRQSHSMGRASQQTADLAQIEPFLPISEDSGVAGAINKFFSSVSSWSINPNDPVARQVVLDRAASTARTFNETATALGESSASEDRQIRSVVAHINSLAARVRDINAERRTDRRKLEDPSLDASLHAALEELSEYVDFNALHQPDGSVQLMLGGQTSLVIGDELYEVKADFGQPEPRILNETGLDITGQVGSGSLRGLLDTRNELIPAYLTDLNRLATAFADRVNQVLAGGLDVNGSSPVQDLFTYDASVGAASTIRTNPLDPSELAGAELSAPGGNGNILALGSLSGTNEVDGITFNEFYGELGARLGRDLVRAKETAQVQKELVMQARQLRSDRSGVSLDEEATRLVEAQRAYQANAQLFQVLNDLTDTLLGILR